MGLADQLLRRKPTTQALSEVEAAALGLRRSLGGMDLALLGIGAIVGAGIFSSTGQMAAGSPDHPGAGPALILSYLLTALVCGFAALCYAEIAAMVPVAGSAYTYAYVALGELFAWIIGWDLIIEYAVGNIYVAQSWADYFRSFLRGRLRHRLPGLDGHRPPDRRQHARRSPPRPRASATSSWPSTCRPPSSPPAHASC